MRKLNFSVFPVTKVDKFLSETEIGHLSNREVD